MAARSPALIMKTEMELHLFLLFLQNSNKYSLVFSFNLFYLSLHTIETSFTFVPVIFVYNAALTLSNKVLLSWAFRYLDIFNFLCVILSRTFGFITAPAAREFPSIPSVPKLAIEKSMSLSKCSKCAAAES